VLADVADEIWERRQDVRAAHGWVMDTYLLRRVEPPHASVVSPEVGGQGGELGRT